MKDRRNPPLITLHVASDGTIDYCSDIEAITCFKAGTGIYDFYIQDPNFEYVTAHAQSHSTSIGCTVLPHFLAANMFRVGCNNTSTAGGADTSITVTVYGAP